MLACPHAVICVPESMSIFRAQVTQNPENVLCYKNNITFHRVTLDLFFSRRYGFVRKMSSWAASNSPPITMPSAPWITASPYYNSIVAFFRVDFARCGKHRIQCTGQKNSVIIQPQIGVIILFHRFGPGKPHPSAPIKTSVSLQNMHSGELLTDGIARSIGAAIVHQIHDKAHVLAYILSIERMQARKGLFTPVMACDKNGNAIDG
ncbi:hypothetical protein DSTSK_19050 [Desulforhabdus sp. TSK]|nr:hypothetical protein DSTSK_19050 [Desulforhabdus sp. TSK]